MYSSTTLCTHLVNLFHKEYFQDHLKSLALILSASGQSLGSSASVQQLILALWLSPEFCKQWHLRQEECLIRGYIYYWLEANQLAISQSSLRLCQDKLTKLTLLSLWYFSLFPTGTFHNLVSSSCATEGKTKKIWNCSTFQVIPAESN